MGYVTKCSQSGSVASYYSYNVVRKILLIHYP